ncbi:uncharacterized protein LOC123551019 [Mercenaria mercenaria]|uniref:uncharacterized protein LOC123551019 n=1 Tax=Mercenaria mercenaria TaxID=6596 RepID=UPI00234EF11C|nr:uncharacterized protein LOC123551019 [Mercenaria mercenaria]
MNRLVLIAVCLLCCAVIAEESVCGNDDREPVSDAWNYRWFPLSLLDWKGQLCDTDVDSSGRDRSRDGISLIGGGTFSLLERILLFPVCLLEDDEYNKGFECTDAGGTGTALQICQNNDDTCLLEYVIDAGQKALTRTKTSIEENYSTFGLGKATLLAQYLQDIYHNKLLHLDKIPSSVLSALQPLFNCIDTAQTKVITHLGEFTVPDVGLSSTWTLFQHLLKEAKWTTVRYIIVGIVAISLFPPSKQIGRYVRNAMRSAKRLCGLHKETRASDRRFQPSLCPIAEHSSDNPVLIRLESFMDIIRTSKLQMPSPRIKQMLKEHYPMCECFDYQNCNCDGKSFCKESTHFKMCEVFDLLPCNCGGATMNSTSTDCDASANIPLDELLLKSNVCNDDETAHTKCTVTTTDQSVQTVLDVTSRDTSPEPSFEATNVEHHLPHWVQMAVGHYHMHGCKVLQCRALHESNDESKEAANPDTSNASPLDLSQSVSDVSVELLNDSIDAVEHSQDESEEGEDLPRYLDDSPELDSDEEEFNRHLDGSATSDIGSPNINSSFKEGSPYFTANSVTLSDLQDRGDGTVYSTLTRRSPYVEDGLSDLSLNTSCRESEGSLLDVSDINKSVSFTSGEGLIEVAALFALQTIWGLAKRAWQRIQADTSYNDVAIEENECGLYIIRQNNKSTALRPSRRSVNKRSPEHDTTEFHEDDRNNTETVLHYKNINTVSKREVLKTPTLAEINYHRNYGTFNERTYSTRQKQKLYNTILLQSCPNIESPADDEIQEENTDCNNNARYSKRKRDTSKRLTDSDSQADWEDCDCPDHVARKRGRITYKTSQTIDKCLTNSHGIGGISGRQSINKKRTRARAKCEKRRVSKTSPAQSTHKEKRPKFSRSRKDLHSRNQSNDLQVSIDRLSRDLRNTSVNDHIGKYAGDTSDEFADESASSSDEISKSKTALPKTDHNFAYSKTTLRCKENDDNGNASTSDNKACSCKNCKNQHRELELNDIVEKLRSLRCNVWELKNYSYINKNDNTSKVLAWAWSCVEK